MFDLMNPQLMRTEEERRRRDILATIRGSVHAPERRHAEAGSSESGRHLAPEMRAASLRVSR